MVYYVCPNCGQRSEEYAASMIHYNACDVVRVRNVSSPTNSTITGGGAGSQTGQAGVAQAGNEEMRHGTAGVASTSDEARKSDGSKQ